MIPNSAPSNRGGVHTSPERIPPSSSSSSSSSSLAAATSKTATTPGPPERATMDPLVAAEIARRDGDGVAFRARPNHTHRTWARTFSSRPELYIRPRTVAEVEKVVGVARACRRRVATVGCGHSPSDLTCTSSWLVNLDDLDAVLSVDPGTGLVVAQAGVRLRRLCAELDRRGLAMPNLGSINEQSVAGAFATGTHGSSLRHGLLSEHVVALRVTLADGRTVACSPDDDPDLFRAAILSLGALGIVTELTIRAVPTFSLRWSQTLEAHADLVADWSRGALWSRAEFVRVYWLPYSRLAAVWVGDRTREPDTAPAPGFLDTALGYHVYQALLALSHLVPSILPWIERTVLAPQFQSPADPAGAGPAWAVQPSGRALLLNCLYSQFVNEWALPLSKGPEALGRLTSWLNRLSPGDDGYVDHGIPFSADGLHVHAPIEVRVSDTTLTSSPRPFLDPTCADGPTLYINATLYRPYHLDPPCRERYYAAFEWLMRDLGARPHWAKNFDARRPEIEAAFGKDLDRWRHVRDRADPDGMFVGPWHRDRVMADGPRLPLEEVEISRSRARDGSQFTVGSTQ